MQAEKDPKKAAGACLDTVKLDPELYRLGHTKVKHYLSDDSSCLHSFVFCLVFTSPNSNVLSKEIRVVSVVVDNFIKYPIAQEISLK
jgi:hypothetical protein